MMKTQNSTPYWTIFWLCQEASLGRESTSAFYSSDGMLRFRAVKLWLPEDCFLFTNFFFLVSQIWYDLLQMQLKLQLLEAINKLNCRLMTGKDQVCKLLARLLPDSNQSVIALGIMICSQPGWWDRLSGSPPQYHWYYKYSTRITLTLQQCLLICLYTWVTQTTC